MPADKPFQFGLKSLLLVMAMAGPLALAIVRATGSISLASIVSGGRDFATSFGPLALGIVCLGAAVDIVVVAPLLLVLVHTKRWMRRRRKTVPSRDR